MVRIGDEMYGMALCDSPATDGWQISMGGMQHLHALCSRTGIQGVLFKTKKAIHKWQDSATNTNGALIATLPRHPKSCRIGATELLLGAEWLSSGSVRSSATSAPVSAESRKNLDVAVLMHGIISQPRLSRSHHASSSDGGAAETASCHSISLRSANH